MDRRAFVARQRERGATVFMVDPDDLFNAQLQPLPGSLPLMGEQAYALNNTFFMRILLFVNVLIRNLTIECNVEW